jgi:hypothetical protein
MTAQDNLNEQQFYHGTKTRFTPGEDMIYPGYDRVSGKVGTPRPYAYMTHELDTARGYAERAKGAGEPRVYQVNPLGSYEYDPHQPGASFRSADALRVIREVAPD